MKNLAFIFTFSLLMSSCASNDVALQPMQDNLSSEVQSSSVNKNFLEKIEGYYGAPTTVLDKTNLSELLVRVKSFTGSLKYDNVNSASKYTLYINDSFVTAGKVRFGRDGKLYFEDYHFVEGNKSFYQYYEIGTYEKLNTGVKQGSAVNYKVNSSFEMKYKGRGLNPMNHEEIDLLTDANAKPVKKDFKEFF